MPQIVFLRHGESQWNRENRFTGWADVPLSGLGREEAWAAGETLRAAGYGFDLAYTSLLRRAISTLHLALDALDLLWIPERKSWRLNERHYGALQGLDKAETAAKYGPDQVKLWRRSFDVPPPPVDPADERHPSHDPRYRPLAPEQLPAGESLKMTIARVLPFWNDTIAPTIHGGQRVLVCAHGNSLRALVKHLDGMSDEAIVELNIPTGIPLVYELNADLTPARHFYLGDQDAIARKIDAVATQASPAR